MKIRLYTNLMKDALLAEVDYDVRPRPNRSDTREIIMAGVTVGTFTYDMEALKYVSNPLIKICLYSDTIAQVRAFGEVEVDGVVYLDAIRTGDRFGIMISAEKLGVAFPDFTKPIVSVRGETVGRLAVGGRSACLVGLDEALAGETLKVDLKNFKLRMLPADSASDRLVKLPEWSLFLEEQENGDGTETKDVG